MTENTDGDSWMVLSLSVTFVKSMFVCVLKPKMHDKTHLNPGFGSGKALLKYDVVAPFII